LTNVKSYNLGEERGWPLTYEIPSPNTPGSKLVTSIL